LKTGVESVRVPVDFDSPEDRALYLATAAKKGKIAADAAAWLQRQGHAPTEIEAEGTALRERMARLAKAGQLDEGDRLRVPAKTSPVVPCVCGSYRQTWAYAYPVSESFCPFPRLMPSGQ
jgi:hypothetical protein